MEEVRVVNEVTGGAKGRKLARFDLIPANPLLQWVQYARDIALTNEGGDIDSLQRHAWCFWAGEEFDQATGIPHLAYVAYYSSWLASGACGVVYREDHPKQEGFAGLPHAVVFELAEHFGKGSEKYGDRNWEKGYAWSLSYGALQRHAWAHMMGETIDAETGSPHMIAVLWHALALMEFQVAHPDLDDRPLPAEQLNIDDDIRRLETADGNVGVGVDLPGTITFGSKITRRTAN